MHKILIIEDHETLGYVLVEYLRMHGFETVLEISAEAGLKRLQAYTPDLCLIDVSLPKMDGFELVKMIKKEQPDMPVVFLTARGLKVDRIKGLMLLADDYIVKPVDEEELVLRIRSILRRAHPKINPEKTTYKIGNFLFSPENHSLKRNNTIMQLREKEVAILQILCRNKGQLVNRNVILKEVWGKTDQFTARTMDVHLSKIRKHLSAEPFVSILNIHGQGFILQDDAKDE